MKSHFVCLYKHFFQVFVPSTRPIEEFLESERPPNQSIEEWVFLIGIWGAISYSSLMVMSQYKYDQCVPATAGLNRVEVSVQDPRFWKKLEEIIIKWGQTLSLQSRTFFNHSPLKMYIQWHLKKSKIFVLA
ncbi:hypothetical protein Goklo_006482 [Gossypium klotzschianum]|uniref:Uncharacterized protein n=1 Tax=Gossypium klotzschianum TaxID=34286 RepID=A0A7J8VID4_9ROSI|nr:hypothetical protein [Gossypium klotzschianum]